MMELKNCHDCGAKPGQPHTSGCDVERCSVCGGQCLMCGCTGHDPLFARWIGLWPGRAECQELGLYSIFTSEGWQKCDVTTPGAGPDLNTFYELGYHKIFFVKPKKTASH